MWKFESSKQNVGLMTEIILRCRQANKTEVNAEDM